jgi:hypothetical protein
MQYTTAVLLLMVHLAASQSFITDNIARAFLHSDDKDRAPDLSNESIEE